MAKKIDAAYLDRAMAQAVYNKLDDGTYGAGFRPVRA